MDTQPNQEALKEIDSKDSLNIVLELINHWDRPTAHSIWTTDGLTVEAFAIPDAHCSSGYDYNHLIVRFTVDLNIWSTKLLEAANAVIGMLHSELTNNDADAIQIGWKLSAEDQLTITAEVLDYMS